MALRDEIARLAAPELLPENDRDRLRLKDLLGFRRNPTNASAAVRRIACPCPGRSPDAGDTLRALATGASGVGLASSIGLAIGARATPGVFVTPVY